MKALTAISIALMLLAAGGLSLSCNSSEETAPTATAQPQATGTSVDFVLSDQAGRAVRLSDYRRKLVVLEWINPDCPYVQRHYKAVTMIGLAKKYQPRGVVWLAVNTTHYMKPEDNRKWIESNGLTYPILDDRLGDVGRQFDAKTTPHMFIIDRDGTIAYQGAIDDDRAGTKGTAAVNYVDQALTELLAGQPVSTPRTKPYGCSVKYAS